MIVNDSSVVMSFHLNWFRSLRLFVVLYIILYQI